MLRLVETLTVADLQSWAVWRFATDDAEHDTAVFPADYPAATLDNMLVGTMVRLAGGSLVWALIGNVDVLAPRQTEQSMTMSVWSGTGWTYLARYFDLDYDRSGPAALEAALRIPTEQVFPISFDLRKYTISAPAFLAGEITRMPRERLSRAELMSLAVAGPSTGN